jgi:hypothetical protein
MYMNNEKTYLNNKKEKYKTLIPNYSHNPLTLLLLFLKPTFHYEASN